MPRRKERGPWFWRGAIALMLTSVFGLFAAAAMNQPPATDTETGCRLDRQDPSHTIVLVDQSDPFNATDVAWVRALLEDEARALPKFGRLTLSVPNAASPYDPVTVWSACSPGSAAAANPLFQNPKMIEQAWQSKFHKPLMASAETVLIDTVAPSSPLMEAIFTLADRPDFQGQVPARRLILVSDLMQHSKEFSMYKTGTAWEAFEGSSLMGMRPGLEGVEVVARVVPRQEYALPLGEVKAFWLRWFKDTGAVYGSVT
ncbi:MAG: hypothetical protein CVT79_17995 [Alphaproteobacteria bacterium HGW-Alphaproteobacteria-18]|nr:MAG: hypothetical protein CVT79_17995 [Alphaproteobacteria bacterium HGW-Alphaproteobacteria-18]